MKRMLKRFMAGLLLAALLMSTLPAAALGGSEVNVKDAPYSAAGDGTTDDTAAVQAAVTDCSTAGGGTVLFPSGDYRVGAAVSVPQSVTLRFETGARLLIDSGVTVTMNGELDASPVQIFGGAGALSGSPQNEVGYPQWFGARGDGVTDDTAAFQQAISLLREVEVLPPEVSYLLGGLQLTKPVSLLGRGETKVSLTAADDTQALFTITGPDVVIENFSVDMAASPEGSSVIYFPVSRDKVRIRGLETENAWHVVKDANSPGQLVYNIHFDDVICRNNRSTAFEMRRFYGFVFLRNVVIDNSAMTGVNYPAVNIYNNAGMVLDGVDILGSGGGSGEHGIVLDLSWAVWLRNCRVENVGGYGYYLHNISYYNYFEHTEATDCAAGGYLMDDAWLTQAVGLRSEMTAPGAGTADGLRIQNTRWSTYSDIYMQGHSGNGVTVLDSSQLRLAAVTAADNGGWGIREGATAANKTASQNHINGAVLVDNGGGGKLQGASSNLTDPVEHGNGAGVADSYVAPSSGGAVQPPASPAASASQPPYTVKDGNAELSASAMGYSGTDSDGKALKTYVLSPSAVAQAAADGKVARLLLTASSSGESAAVEIPARSVQEMAELDKGFAMEFKGARAELPASELRKLAGKGESLVLTLSAVQPDALSGLKDASPSGGGWRLTLSYKPDKDGKSTPVEESVRSRLVLPVEKGKRATGAMALQNGAWSRLAGWYLEDRGAVAALADGATALVLPVYTEGMFRDAFSSASLRTKAEALLTAGIVEGMSEGRFEPQSTLTRAQMARILDNALLLEGTPEGGFTDVKPGDWYYDSVRRAAAAGLLLGYDDGSMRPDALLTREQAVTFAARLYRSLTGEEAKGGEEAKKLPDGSKISDYALDAVSLALANGLLEDKASALRPADPADRAFMATLIWNTLDAAYRRLAD